MARSKTAQPKHSLRKIAVVVATAVSGMSVYAQAAVEPKEDTITVTAAPAPQESAWGPAATIAAKHSATATKTDTPIEKTPQSISVVTNEEMQMHQFQSVKEALGYTPGVTDSSRGASNTYDFVIIRGFSSVGLNQNNYLDGLKLQGNFYNDAVIDPYMLERVELMRGPTSVLYGKSNPGGIISMVSKRPTTEPLKEIQFKMGTDNLFQTGFDFSDSSVAYQGAGRGLDQDEVAWLNNYATDGHKPDLTLLFDVDSETGLARIAANGEREVNRLDLEKLDMHQRVRQGYLDLAEAEPERIKRIDASQTLEEVVEDTWEIIKSYL